MEYKEILKNLRAKNYAPVYLLMGEEGFYIDKVSDFIHDNVLTEAEKAFNLTVLYGKDTGIVDLMEMAKRFPMSSNHQIIIVKEAQKLKDLDKLVYYVENPLKSTLLVLCYKYGNLDKRSKLYKAIKKTGIILESLKVKDYKLAAEIEKMVKEKKYEIEPRASEMLAGFLGSDLSKVDKEIDKLIFTLKADQKSITPDHVERNIGISKEFNVFELTKAIGNRDYTKANLIVAHLGENPKQNPFVVIISVLFTYWLKVLKLHYLKDKSKANVSKELGINPYFVNEQLSVAKAYPPMKTLQNISLLREYDVKSKGFKGCVTKSDELLKELVFKLMH